MKAIELLGTGEEMHGRSYIRLDREQVKGAMLKLKDSGFNHFVMLSCVDWIDSGEFEVVYHLWSYGYREHVMLSVRVPRDNPSIPSLHGIFPQIGTYEREAHEMYGIDFEGNKDMRPFLMEGWHDIPPMRKDFDSRKFEEEVFESIPEIGEDDDE